MDCGPPAPLWDFPGKNTEVGCHFLLQEIFLIQELNQGHLQCRKFFTIWASRESKEADSVEKLYNSLVLGQKETATFHGSYKALLHKSFLTDFHLDNISIDIWAYSGIFRCTLSNHGLKDSYQRVWEKEGKSFYEGECFTFFLSFGFLHCQERTNKELNTTDWPFIGWYYAHNARKSFLMICVIENCILCTK